MPKYRAKRACTVVVNPSEEDSREHRHVMLLQGDYITTAEELDCRHLEKVSAVDTSSVKDSLERGGLNKERRVVSAVGGELDRIDDDKPKPKKPAKKKKAPNVNVTRG